MKPLTEAQAWNVIAARYDDAATGRVGARPLRGICNQIARLKHSDLITERMEDRMHNRKDVHGPQHRRAYWWPCNRDGAVARRDFCERMARLADT